MTGPRVVQLAYGEGRIALELDPGLADWHVIAPQFPVPLDDAREAFVKACHEPVGSPPLREIVRPGDRVTIVTSDGTRPVPNRVLIPWLLEQLPVPIENITVLLGNGTHRPNTPDEIAAMFGADLASKLTILNHDAVNPDANAFLGTASGIPVWLDRHYVEADKRIALGFIEPHFFAGFSGGAKAVAPGIAGIETIFGLHTHSLIDHPQSTWGVFDGNPVQEAIRAAAKTCPPDFLINVTLDGEKRITGIYAGDYLDAHRVGCERVRHDAMAPAPRRFPVVITSNSGFPLDQNLYQTVKGMSAGAQVLAEGGSLIMVSECRDGIPAEGHFQRMIRRGETPSRMAQTVRELKSPVLDQWQVQVLARLQEKARIALYSSMDASDVEACGFVPVAHLGEYVRQRIEQAGRGVPVAVLAEGPVTILYLIR